MDVIGQIGLDPGSEWAGTTCTLGTKEAVIRRNFSIKTGDNDGTNAFDPDTELDVFCCTRYFKFRDSFQYFVNQKK